MRRFFRTYFLPILLLLCALGRLSGLDLKTEAIWEYAPGQHDQSVEDAADLAYSPLTGFQHLEELIPGEVGFLWIRAQFQLPRSLMNEDLALLLGKIIMAEEVYFNGEKIGTGGRFPPRFFSQWNMSRYYELSPLIVRRSNTLFIKLYVHYEGSINETLMIDERREVLREYQLEHFVNTVLNGLISAILLVIALYHFLIYLQRKKALYNLFYSFLAFCFAIYLSNFYITLVPGFLDLNISYLVFQKIVFIAMYLTLFNMGMFISSFLNRKESKLFYIVYGSVLALAVLLFLIAPNFRVFNFFRNTLKYTLIIPPVYVIIQLIQEARKKQKEVVLIIIGLSPLFAAILFDLIVREILYIPGTYLTGFGAPLFMVTILFILGVRFVGYAKEVERLNLILEQKVEERTSQLQETNRKLEELSINDPLTNIFNRRAFTERYTKELLRSRRTQNQLSLMMLDIDRFKKVNDTYGHLCGDRCLIQVADVIRKNLKRPADFLARYGGEEFSALLPNTGPDGAEQLAEKIRQEIEELELQFKGDTFRITISIGVATLIIQYNTPDERLLSLADKALYRAKSNGRNQVVMAES